MKLVEIVFLLGVCPNSICQSYSLVTYFSSYLEAAFLCDTYLSLLLYLHLHEDQCLICALLLMLSHLYSPFSYNLPYLSSVYCENKVLFFGFAYFVSLAWLSIWSVFIEWIRACEQLWYEVSWTLVRTGKCVRCAVVM